MKKIGLFGGSFDPIHFGHLNLCISLLEAHGLDQILFCPASLSPFKLPAPPHAAKEHRREMLQLALAPFPQFQLFDWELQQQGPIYTIDTVKALRQQYEAEKNSVQLHLILGGDMLSSLHQWKEAETLIRLAPPLIGGRGGANSRIMPQFSPQILEIVSHGFTPVPMMEITSTLIRERLCQGNTCRHLIPSNVLDYIEEHRLYSHDL